MRALAITIVLLCVPVGLGAQHADIPRTRTLPGLASTAFPYAQPQEVGVSSEKLERLADEITEWVANGDLVGAELLIIKDGRALFHEAYGTGPKQWIRAARRGTSPTDPPRRTPSGTSKSSTAARSAANL